MREISHTAILEACALLGIDPESTSSFTITMEGSRAGVTLTVTEPVRLFDRVEHDPF